MRGDEELPSPAAADEERVVIAPVLPAELDEVARHELRQLRLAPIGAGSGVAAEEVAEILYPGPGRGAQARAVVVPAEGLPAVHNQAAGQQALGYEIRAVPALAGEVVKQRVAPQGPAAGVFQGLATLIWQLA